PLLAAVDARDIAISLFAWRDGVFVLAGTLATGKLPAQILSADLDADGGNDLVVRNAGDGTLSICFNKGPGTAGTGTAPFRPPVTLSVGPGLSDVAAADVHQDGVRDLLLTNKFTGEVGVL